MEPLDDLWTGLPRSNVYKQKKLTGWREPDAERGDELEVVRRVSPLATGRLAELRAFQDATGRGVDTVMLGAYHVLLQWYLDDLESLIGQCSLVGERATWRASYVYAEDEDSIETLLGEVERQQRDGRALDVDLSDVASPSVKRAPVFFYAGLGNGHGHRHANGNGRGDGHEHGNVTEQGSSSDVSWGSLLFAEAFQQQRVIVAADSGAAEADLRVSMPGVVSRAIGIEVFQQRYDRVLAALVAGGCSLVGDVKARLGEASEIPYRQLDEMQRRVIALWAKVLGIAESGLSEESNYFALGGTSLNAFKLMNRVRVELGKDVSIWEIVENPTIAEFSRVLLTVSA